MLFSCVYLFGSERAGRWLHKRRLVVLAIREHHKQINFICCSRSSSQNFLIRIKNILISLTWFFKRYNFRNAKFTKTYLFGCNYGRTIVRHASPSRQFAADDLHVSERNVLSSKGKIFIFLFLNNHGFDVLFKFVELLEQTANFAKDRSVINALNANSTQKLTVFVPTNDALLQLGSQQQTQTPEVLRNNLNNLIIKRKHIFVNKYLCSITKNWFDLI